MPNELFQDVIRYPNLPSLPAIAARVLELTSDPDVQIKTIAEVVQKDQALSGKVLKTVNSSFYGLSERCGSIERAMGFLGLNTVKSLVLGFSLVDLSGEMEGSGFDMEQHWRQTILGAVGAKVICEITKVSDADEVFSAGLFQDIGVLAMFAAMRGRYTDVISGSSHGEFSRFEKESFGFDHTLVGAELSKKWNLPERIVEAILHHHDTGDVAECVDPGMSRCVIAGTLIGEVFGSEDTRSALSRLQRKLGAFFPDQRLDAEQIVDKASKDAVMLAEHFDTSIGEIGDVRELMDKAQEAGLEHQISMQRQSEELQREATIDGLTGLENRKRFDQALGDAYAQFRSSGEEFSVLFMDADKFKSVNDTHGHAVGDAVLVELAARGASSIGDAGTLFRYGGEEFAAVLPGVDGESAARIAEHLRASIEAPEFDLTSMSEGPDSLRVTISIGVSSTSLGSASRIEDGETLVKEADESVYAAKEAGRNRVVCWGKKVEDAPASVTSLTRREGDVTDLVLIEDDPLAATLLLTLLKRTGTFSVRWFQDGDEVCAFFEESIGKGELPCDVVLSDLDLPGKNGAEIFSAFHAMGLFERVPFFVLSANVDSSEFKSLEGMSVTGAIGKADFAKHIGKWIGVISESVKQSAAAA